MKRVKILKYQIGLVTKQGTFMGVLNAGTHWVGLFDEVTAYNTLDTIVPSIPLEVLMQDAQMRALLTVVEIADNQIGIQYKGKNIESILLPGKRAYWNSIADRKIDIYNMDEIEVPDTLPKRFIPRYTTLYNNILTIKVDTHEQGLMYINGQYEKALAAGTYYFWKNDQNVTVNRIDTRLIALEISGQELLTKDKAALRINFDMQYQVVDIVKALESTKDYARQLYLMIQMELRAFIGTLTLDELLARKEDVGAFVLENTVEKLAEIGVVMKSGGIKDIILPGEVKEIMNQVLIAEKRAQANIITRREETASTRSLMNTAKLMENNEMLFKLKEMEYVEKIAEKINNISLSGGSQVVEQLKDIFTKN